MCGKFTQMMSWGELVALADILGAPASPIEFVTPMRDAVVIRRGVDGRRETARMRWGFVPRWAKTPGEGPRHIHARSEEIEIKPTFKESFFERRGLVVVSSFNEGEDVSPRKTIQHVITPDDGRPLAIAVIWDVWGEPHAGDLTTFAMITVPSNKLISAITDRMPAILQPADWAKWLGEEPATFDELKAMLKPAEGDWTMRLQNPPKAARPGPAKGRPGEPTLF